MLSQKKLMKQAKYSISCSSLYDSLEKKLSLIAYIAILQLRKKTNKNHMQTFQGVS